MTPLLLVPLLALAPAQADVFLPADQIHWQRSADDARALAAQEGRPLLVAINLDGESASDRIVRERYRDPRFVAWTRRFVCVVGHPFRHVPRDHDDEGRRIECPRLGLVTCGEHVRLEPELFDAHLGGERVSPRHALVMPDGTKAFDLFLLFDLRELDAALERAADAAPAESAPRHDQAAPEAARLALAGARDAASRALFEALAAGVLPGPDADDPRAWGGPLDFVRAIRARGDAGSIDALRPILAREVWPAGLLDEVAAAAAERGFAPQLAAAVQGVLAAAGPHPGSAALARDRRLVPLLGQLLGQLPGPLAGGAEAPRAFLVALAAAAPAADRAAALAALPGDERAAVEAALASAGGAVEVEDLLRLGAELAAGPPARATLPPRAPPDPELDLAELEAADRDLARAPDDPERRARFGRAHLGLALARIATSGAGVGLLFQDAEVWLARAAEARPADDALALDRARCAYWLARFDEQARLGAEVLERRRARAEPHAHALRVLERWSAWGSGAPAGRDEAARAALAYDDVAHEALRWIGDAEGRRAAEVGLAPAERAARVARGARALATACASRHANDVDHQSLATFLRAHGLARPALAAARQGVARFPRSNVLRDLYRDLCAAAGRPDHLVATADWLAGRAPDSAAEPWYAGYAWFLAAEWSRRAGRAEAALRDYDAAAERFARSLELEPAFADSALHYLALAHMGRGFAHVLAGRKQDAADALARALALWPAVGDLRDGLDREALDLVDAALEWTETHGESRVNPVAFADALSRAVPGEARWLRAVSDACLREGLRADGRLGRTRPVPEAMRAAGQPAELREPGAAGDRWLEHAIAIAARARAVSDDEDSRRYEAQARAVHAERLLVTQRVAEAEPLLVESARLLGQPARAGEEPHALARRLRERLGDARPVTRPGR